MLDRVRSYLAPILGLVVVSLCTGAQAGMVTYTVATGNGYPNYSQIVQVPSFNSSLGKLTSVSYYITDEAAMGGPLMSKANGIVPEYTISDTLVLTASFGSQSVTNTLAESQDFYNVSRSETVDFGGTLGFHPSGTSLGNAITNPSVLLNFEGAVPLNFDFSANATVAIGGMGGNAFADIVTTVNTSIIITYTFTPSVPEPASIAMATLGGLLVAAARYARNRMKTAAVAD